MSRLGERDSLGQWVEAVLGKVLDTGICGPYAFVERSPHRLWLGYVLHSRFPYTHREARRTKHVSRETCEKDFLGAHLAGLRGSKCAWSWVERWHSAGLPVA